jgi:MFS transporter, DHA1 family, inner membrane transport protein
MGLRRALVFGSVLCSLSCPVLALVDGVGLALASFTALGQVFYCTCYYVFFSALGDADHRGSQIGLIQAFGAVAALAGPGIGGLLLMTFGPWAAFGAAFLVGLAAALPLLHIDEPPVERAMSRGAYAAATSAVRLYFDDGWIQVSLTAAWSIVMFQALGGRYDSFGGTLSLAAVAGAVGGLVLGRLIDTGRARAALWLNAAVLAAGLVLRCVTFSHAAAVVAIAVGTTMLSGLYLPHG